MCGLRDVGGVDQVVIGVPVFAVSVLQSFNELHQSLHRNLNTVQQVIQALGESEAALKLHSDTSFVNNNQYTIQLVSYLFLSEDTKSNPKTK